MSHELTSSANSGGGRARSTVLNQGAGLRGGLALCYRCTALNLRLTVHVISNCAIIYFYLQVRRFLGFSTAFRVSPSDICTSDRARLTFASVYEFACVEVSPM
jgi:hypothetical protein